MDKKIGFIGSGNMAQAIINGLIKSQISQPSQINVFDTDTSKAEALRKEVGTSIASSSKNVTENCDILIVAVKPQIIPIVLREIASSIKSYHVVVSIAAGVTLAQLAEYAGHQVKFVRVMPNTPAMVNSGMSSLTPNSLIEPNDLKDITTIFNSFGRSAVVPESQIHAVTGISGSAPAYVFMFIEALADAGVLGGIPRDQAYQFAAQAVMGSAQMVLKTGCHPAVLKDMVCSPGGTTIEAVKTLEEHGFRSTVMDAAISCMNKSRQMSEKIN
ncbi:pyrroline-5-carboxylate reductase [Pantoea agglomerans]|uniref:pyrroline-5-carboxylate reductase n=1 Tax=Enterobacter agglomerans TaxID=549 RepID=UPI0013C8958B|nr:pyrroline-5-carboxylate reductase [Pantoea agglomerans]NEG59758.1 pyrroline-5-carboxylate reductase [Pantoea agglomerans]NEH05296.1 pyrroline-5-carboxylate reductase [Pantoea agglomerans]NEH16328.1 pyrroline-5-carboxylate reductase [Pantoea agglomerans]